jgi:hypothetical protein
MSQLKASGSESFTFFGHDAALREIVAFTARLMVAVTATYPGVYMTAIVQAFSRVTGIEIKAETLGAILLFSCIGLVVSLLAATTYGLDLSAGFF